MSAIRRMMMRSGNSVDWQAMYYGLVDGSLSGELLLPSGLTTIRYFLCYLFTGITSVSIPNTVTRIEQNAFYGTQITSIELPSALTYIGNSAFRLTPITSLSLPNSLTTIDSAAFRDCTELEGDIIVPSGVTAVTGQVFYNCKKVNSFEFGNGVTTIAAQAFSGCNALSYIIFRSTTPPTLANANALNSSNNCDIFVPNDSVNTYKTASVWSGFASRIKSLNDFTT